VILRDDRGQTATVNDALRLLQLAVDVYKRDANVRIVPSQPFKYTTGFTGGDTVDASWVVEDGAESDATILHVPCGAGGVGAEWLVGGSIYQWKASTLCFFGNWRRVLGYGSPVTCFFVRDVVGALGCALWITDYVTVEGTVLAPPSSSPRTLGHEVGHACNLWHTCVDDDNSNLMATQEACDPDSTVVPNRLSPRMSNSQVLLVRMSKHVTYF
jgi:hypothetical protein